MSVLRASGGGDRERRERRREEGERLAELFFGLTQEREKEREREKGERVRNRFSREHARLKRPREIGCGRSGGAVAAAVDEKREVMDVCVVAPSLFMDRIRT